MSEGVSKIGELRAKLVVEFLPALVRLGVGDGIVQRFGELVASRTSDANEYMETVYKLCYDASLELTGEEYDAVFAGFLPFVASWTSDAMRGYVAREWSTRVANLKQQVEHKRLELKELERKLTAERRRNGWWVGGVMGARAGGREVETGKGKGEGGAEVPRPAGSMRSGAQADVEHKKKEEEMPRPAGLVRIGVKAFVDHSQKKEKEEEVPRPAGSKRSGVQAFVDHSQKKEKEEEEVPRPAGSKRSGETLETPSKRGRVTSEDGLDVLPRPVAPLPPYNPADDDEPNGHSVSTLVASSPFFRPRDRFPSLASPSTKKASTEKQSNPSTSSLKPTSRPAPVSEASVPSKDVFHFDSDDEDLARLFPPPSRRRAAEKAKERMHQSHKKGRSTKFSEAYRRILDSVQSKYGHRYPNRDRDQKDSAVVTEIGPRDNLEAVLINDLAIPFGRKEMEIGISNFHQYSDTFKIIKPWTYKVMATSSGPRALLLSCTVELRKPPAASSEIEEAAKRSVFARLRYFVKGGYPQSVDDDAHGVVRTELGKGNHVTITIDTSAARYYDMDTN